MTSAIPRVRPFTAYLGTQVTWFFAFGLQTTLFPFLALIELDVGEARFGLAQTTLLAPSLLLLMLGGVMAERRDRRSLLAWLHAAALVPPLALAAAATAGALTFAYLLAYGVWMGVLGALMMPTRDAALNAVAAAEGGLSVQQAVVLASLAQFVGQITGMSLASLAPVVGFAHPAPFLLAAQAGMVAAGGLAALALPALPPAADAGRSGGVWADLRDGVAIVWRMPVIRSMVIVMIAVGVFVIGGGFFVLLPLIVQRMYGGGLTELGVIFITFWAGAAVATIALARFGHVDRPGRALAGVFFVGAASLGALTLHAPFAVLVALVALWGAASGVGIAMSRSIVQEAAPPEALARVLSIYQLGFMGGAPIGALATGALAAAFGPRLTALAPMAGLAGAALWMVLASPVARVQGAREPVQE